MKRLRVIHVFPWMVDAHQPSLHNVTNSESEAEFHSSFLREYYLRRVKNIDGVNEFATRILVLAAGNQSRKQFCTVKAI